MAIPRRRAACSPRPACRTGYGCDFAYPIDRHLPDRGRSPCRRACGAPASTCDLFPYSQRRLLGPTAHRIRRTPDAANGTCLHRVGSGLVRQQQRPLGDRAALRWPAGRAPDAELRPLRQRRGQCRDRPGAAAPGNDLAEAGWAQAVAHVMEDVAIVPVIERKTDVMRSSRVRNCIWSVLGQQCQLTAVWLADAAPRGGESAVTRTTTRAAGQLLEVRDLASRSARRTASSRRCAASRSTSSAARRSASSANRAPARASPRRRWSGSRGGRGSTGEALFEGQNLLAMSPDELRAIRGRGIAMIFQNPLSSLHPLYRDRLADRRDDPRARAGTEAPGARPGHRAARARRDPAPGPARGRLPAPVLRRDAAARDDRDGARAQSAHCSSPTSRRRRSTSRCRRRSSGCCGACSRSSAWRSS